MFDKEKNKVIEEELNEIYSKKEDTELRAKWAKTLKEDFQIEKQPIQKKLNLTIYLVAASFLALVSYVGYNFMSTGITIETTTQIAKLEVLSNNKFSHRGSNPNAKSNLSFEAYQSMLNEDFTSATQAYNAISNSQALTPYEKYHLALSYVKSRESKSSIPILIQLVEEGDSYHQEAKWMLALAYLETENKVKAKEILNEIVVSKTYKNKTAKILLKKL